MTKLTSAAWGKAKYVSAHPDSECSDPNYSDRIGYELVAIQPNGLLIYRRKPWWRRAIRLKI